MTNGTQAIERALTLLDMIICDDAQTPIYELSSQIGLAPSSARRMTLALKHAGLIMPAGRGRYMGGPRLRALADIPNPHRRLIQCTRPLLQRLANRSGLTAHLGIFDDSMVTYLVKEGEGQIFTRVNAQLEAYCTGIGKVLLSLLPEKQLDDYLANTFVRLTPNTICDPDQMREEIATIRARGYAIDDGEMSEAVVCVARSVPLNDGSLAAISLTGERRAMILDQADRIAHTLSGVARNIADRYNRQDRQGD
jgi:IclR family acetate operon transcriptional repressor